MHKRLARWILRKELHNLHRLLAHEVAQEPTRNIQVVTQTRIPREVWKTVKDRLPKHTVGTTSTALQTAALVGQQAVVDLIEHELVI